MQKDELEVLETAYQYIEALYSGIKDVKTLYAETQEIQAYNTLTQISEGLEWLVEVIKLSRIVSIPAESIAKLSEGLNEIVNALENEDKILIVDILEYEIIPVLKMWYDFIGEGIERSKKDA